MTERELLDLEARRLRRRISGRARVLHDEVERAVGPVIREHPRTGMAVAASAGFVAGRLLGGAIGTRGGGLPGGIVAGAGSFLGGAGLRVLRAKLVDALLSAGEEAAPDGEAD